LTNYFGDKHTNRTGLYYSHLGYSIDIQQSPSLGEPLSNLSIGNGRSRLFQLYSSSKIHLNSKFELNGGVHMLYFHLNKEYSVEPRLAVKYKINQNQSVALAYGLHSRIEDLPVYFVNAGETLPNRNLKLMKSNQVVFSYSNQLADNLKFTIEPYYQHLTNVPVSPYSYISAINVQNSLFFDEVLESTGTARNIGVDVTLERFLNNGLYYMLSASIFDSKYTVADGIERNTRLNKNYVFNGLIGKEWQVGRNQNNILSANIRMNYLGGNRKEAIDIQQSEEAQDVVYGEVDQSLSFKDKYPDLPVLSFTISYRKNKKKHSSVWALQVLNALQTKDFESNILNLNTQSVEEKFSSILIPNLSYKIEF
jgi:hypothetical protein